MIVGIACGLWAACCMLLDAGQVRANDRSAREAALDRDGSEQVEVYVAQRDIAFGQVISADDVAPRLWLADLLPADCATDARSVVGMTATSTILANEPIPLQRVGTSGSLDVPAGLCAVSVPTQDTLAVGGAVDKGSLVDVYASGNDGVVLLGQRILVLETSSSAAGSSRSGSLSWITLAVTQESVEELLNASRAGKLYITLPGQEVPVAAASDTMDGVAAPEAGERHD